jgi:uncharacterized membrane protein
MTTWNARMITNIPARQRFAAMGMIANLTWLVYFVPVILSNRWTKTVGNGKETFKSVSKVSLISLYLSAWILNLILGIINFYYAYYAPPHLVAKPMNKKSN